MSISTVLLLAVAVVGVAFVAIWIMEIRRRKDFAWPNPIQLVVGFITDFFDTLGIGSFAPTISFFKFFKLVPDERVPGTLNVGHALPTIFEAFAFIAIVNVDPITLVSMILASVAGAWLGAGLVARLPKRAVQIGIGGALLVAAALFLTKNLNWIPGGGDALGLTGPMLAFAIFANFCLGALMTLGIGLYAPALILVSLLGMNPKTAWPIMMGSCAFLMPIASIRFIKLDAYSLKAALGLTIGGIPGVLIAAYIVKSLPITAVRWLVVVVVIYAAVSMLRSAASDRKAATVPQRA
ncbi:MAG: sulfite exporter TauE/SafE family protein [Candidatus Baltobacteraceae bacterium]